jgi:hypothetical protein
LPDRAHFARRGTAARAAARAAIGALARVVAYHKHVDSKTFQ